MDSKLVKSKIKVAIIGSGNWGSQIADAIKLINRYKLIGSINTSTEESEKKEILQESDLWYIAVPQEAQLEYLKNGLALNKHIICETPTCSSIQERKEIYDILLTKSGNQKVFYCNFPYFLDQDFARLMSGGLLKKAKFISIKCSGPKFKESPDKAKKFYINQAFNLILNTAGYINIRHFDKFIIRDDFFGELHSNDITYLFEWGYSEYPKLDLKINGDGYAKTSEIIYDEYDQVLPLLSMFSDKILNLNDNMPSSYIQHMQNEEEDFVHKLSVSSYLTSCSAEYFSDIFCRLNGKSCNISDQSMLFLNGGFHDTSYSVINNYE
jgi:hypothetical protein